MLTPLRAWAHDVPRYYLQNFGNPVSHPNSNDYSAFLQDTIRVTGRLALSLGVRYDMQTFNSKDLVNNPLWPASGKMPSDKNNFSPRVGLAYSIGNQRPLVVRGGFGIFYTRLPQLYESAVINNDGLAGTFLFLDNADTTQHQIFPTYPNRDGDVQSGAGGMYAAGFAQALSDQRCFGVRAELCYAQSAAGQFQRRARACGPVCRGRFVFVRTRREPDPGARCESAAADGVQLSHLRFDRQQLHQHLLPGGFVRDVADAAELQLSISAVHQRRGAADVAVERDQPI